MHSRGLWVPEEHPDNVTDKGALLLVPGSPNHLVPIVLADVLLQQHRRIGKLCGYTSSCVADIRAAWDAQDPKPRVEFGSGAG